MDERKMSNSEPHTYQFIKYLTLCNLTETLFTFLKVVKYPDISFASVGYCLLYANTLNA